MITPTNILTCPQQQLAQRGVPDFNHPSSIPQNRPGKIQALFLDVIAIPAVCAAISARVTGSLQITGNPDINFYGGGLIGALAWFAWLTYSERGTSKTSNHGC